MATPESLYSQDTVQGQPFVGALTGPYMNSNFASNRDKIDSEIKLMSGGKERAKSPIPVMKK